MMRLHCPRYRLEHLRALDRQAGVRLVDPASAKVMGSLHASLIGLIWRTMTADERS